MTAKKKTLIELMLDAGVKPECLNDRTEFIVCDSASEGTHCISEYHSKPKFKADTQKWYSNGFVSFNLDIKYACKNWKRTIITKQQFVDAYNEKHKFEDLHEIPEWNKQFKKEIYSFSDAGGSMNKVVTNIPEDKQVEDIEPCKVVKTAQQFALEKFGKDWHENTGEQPFGDDVVIDVISAHDGYYEARRPVNDFSLSEKLFDKLIIKKWRIHAGSVYECSDSTCNKQKTLDEAFCEPVAKLNVTVENNTQHAIHADLSDIDTEKLKREFHEAGKNCALTPDHYSIVNGKDLIARSAESYKTDEFRGAMRFNIEKYIDRLGKKDSLVKELRKIADYANRWADYEEKLQGSK